MRTHLGMYIPSTPLNFAPAVEVISMGLTAAKNKELIIVSLTWYYALCI